MSCVLAPATAVAGRLVVRHCLPIAGKHSTLLFSCCFPPSSSPPVVSRIDTIYGQRQGPGASAQRQRHGRAGGDVRARRAPRLLLARALAAIAGNRPIASSGFPTTSSRRSKEVRKWLDDWLTANAGPHADLRRPRLRRRAVVLETRFARRHQPTQRQARAGGAIATPNADFSVDRETSAEVGRLRMVHASTVPRRCGR